MAHLKRLLAPDFWKISKKEFKWTVSPRPGPHPKFECIPLLIIVRDILELAETGREAKRIIKKGEILVDGRARKDHAYPVGLMDVITIPKIEKYYRIVPSKKGLGLIEIEKKEADLKLCKIVNKTTIKGNKTQLNLHDGRNMLVKEDEYKTGDSLLIQLPSQKIKEHLKLEKNSLVMVLKGKNAGKMGKVKNILPRRHMTERNKVICDIEGKKSEVLKEYVFVVGKDKPVIKLG